MPTQKPQLTPTSEMTFAELEASARACTLCSENLPLGPRPVFQISPTARILIAGQAPGRRVHETGVPFNDPSGDRLRAWMGIDRATFYDARRVAIIPMGFCYPGTGKSGDLPPRPECAETWRKALLAQLGRVELTLVIGQYALDWHLPERTQGTLTETVQAWRSYQPSIWPMPHPSPRNNLWLKKNLWFEQDVLPELRREVGRILTSD